MEMMIKKVVTKQGQKNEFINSIIKINDSMRVASGFISAILLDSKTQEDSVYLFSMWMDNETLSSFDKLFEKNKAIYNPYIESVTSEPLDVLLSITTEGDFKPVVN